jgi:chitinase
MRTRISWPLRPILLVLALLTIPVAQAAPQYTITVNVVGQGTVVLDPLKTSYQRNNIVTLTAVPAAADDWSFARWEGDLGGSQNPTTLRVSRNHTVTAVFTQGSSGGGGGGGGGTEPPPPTGELPSSGMIVGYFAQWTIYRRGYLPKHVAQSGAVNDLHVINYAFAAPDANLRCASLDSFADYEKRFDASESVDGVGDSVSQPLKGNFNQLLKLKVRNPALRVLISLGGWTQSHRFSDVALTEQSRRDFVASCVDMFIKGNVAPGVSAAGVFDGIDLDWEYPGSCGNTCDFRAEDRQNFPLLLAEFRRQLDAYGASRNRRYLLTIAAPAGAANYGAIDVGAIHPFLDWINVMAYDFHGGWESLGPTNHHAALYPAACESAQGNWGDKAMQAYLGGGVPPAKLLLGVPFYGRGWRGVAAVGDGLCQPASGVPRGTYEKGIEDFEVLEAKGRPDFWSAAQGAHWTFDGSEFWSYDDVCSAGWKANYANSRGLRGAMTWELSGDDPAGSLLKALRGRFAGAPAPAHCP